MIDYIDKGTPLFQENVRSNSFRFVHAMGVLESGSVFVRRGGINFHDDHVGDFAIVTPDRLYIECPVCQADGIVFDKRHQIECPACNGNGHISIAALNSSTSINEDLKHAMARIVAHYGHLNLREEALANRADRKFDEGR